MTGTKTYIKPVDLAKAAGVKPQVIYNLIRQGYLAAEDVPVTEVRKMIPESVAAAWLTKRSEKAAAKVQNVEADLSGRNVQDRG